MGAGVKAWAIIGLYRGPSRGAGKLKRRLSRYGKSAKKKKNLVAEKPNNLPLPN